MALGEAERIMPDMGAQTSMWEQHHAQHQVQSSAHQQQHVQQQAQQQREDHRQRLPSPTGLSVVSPEKNEAAPANIVMDEGVGDVVADIETKQVENFEEETSSDEEEQVAANNWLAQTLKLASRLWNANEELAEPEEPDQDENDQEKEALPLHQGDDNLDILKENNVRNDSKSIAKVQSTEKDQHDYEHNHDNDDSIHTTDSDVITVADVMSLTEQSLEKASTPEQRQGLLRLKSMLAPKKAVKQIPKSILGGDPNWKMDGDSEVGLGNNDKKPPQQQEEESAISRLHNSTAQVLNIKRLFPEEKTSKKDAVTQEAEEMVIHTVSDAQIDLADAKGDDEAIWRGQVEFTTNNGNEKNNRRETKRKVQRTLKSIHRLLRDNLRSITEKEQAPDSIKLKMEEKGKKKEKGLTKSQISDKRGRRRSGSSQRSFIFRSRSQSNSGSQGTLTVRSRSRSSSRKDSIFRSRTRTRSGSPTRLIRNQSGSQRGFTSGSRSRSRSRSRRGSLTSRMKDQSGSQRGLSLKSRSRSGSPTGKMMDRNRDNGGKPSSQAQLLIDVHVSETRLGKCSSQTELRVDAALARNRSRSPTRHANYNGAMTTQAIQKEDICSAASGFDSGRRRSRSPSTRVRTHNEVDHNRQNSPSIQPKIGQAHDDGLRTRRRPGRINSDGSRRRTMARAKINEESGSKKTLCQEKSSSRPRKTTSFDEGHVYFDNLGLDFAGDLAFHESFASLKTRRGRARRRSSLSTIVSQETTTSSTEEQQNVKPRRFSPSHYMSLIDEMLEKEEMIDVDVNMQPIEQTPKKKKQRKGQPKCHASLSGESETSMRTRSLGKHIKNSKSKQKQTPLQYLVKKGLLESEAHAVVEASGMNDLEDFSIMDDSMISVIAKEAGLKPIPTKKLCNAIKAHTETLDSRSLP